MNPYTPALNQKEYNRKMEDITLCGKNRGPHDYIPTAWIEEENKRYISILMCRVCFVRITMKTCYDLGHEAKMP